MSVSPGSRLREPRLRGGPWAQPLRWAGLRPHAPRSLPPGTSPRAERFARSGLPLSPTLPLPTFVGEGALAGVKWQGHTRPRAAELTSELSSLTALQFPELRAHTWSCPGPAVLCLLACCPRPLYPPTHYTHKGRDHSVFFSMAQHWATGSCWFLGGLWVREVGREASTF